MDEDTPPPEKPRFLLPDGCKDLHDVLLHQRVTKEKPGKMFSASSSLLVRPPDAPQQVWLTDPVTVKDLATAIHVPPFHLVELLMQLNMFTSVNHPLDFKIAQAICGLYQIAASRAE